MTAKSAGEAGENPLVPNEKLRQMYIKMLEARVLEEAVTKRAKSRGRRGMVSVRGQEAIRVSTALELGADDLVSDAAATAAMGSILGGDARALLRGLALAKADRDKVLAEAGVKRLLRGASDSEERLQLATGAALALKAQGRGGIVVAYARKGELTPGAWRKVLGSAAKLELPIIFVVLDGAGSRKKNADFADVCDAAKAVGVPGIPVDACDAIALYRVTQESLGRTRGGDGPVLIESVHWAVNGRGRSGDPLESLRETLLTRKISKATWFEETEKKARKQLKKKNA